MGFKRRWAVGGRGAYKPPSSTALFVTPGAQTSDCKSFGENNGREGGGRWGEVRRSFTHQHDNIKYTYSVRVRCDTLMLLQTKMLPWAMIDLSICGFCFYPTVYPDPSMFILTCLAVVIHPNRNTALAPACHWACRSVE